MDRWVSLAINLLITSVKSEKKTVQLKAALNKVVRTIFEYYGEDEAIRKTARDFVREIEEP